MNKIKILFLTPLLFVTVGCKEKKVQVESVQKMLVSENEISWGNFLYLAKNVQPSVVRDRGFQEETDSVQDYLLSPLCKKLQGDETRYIINRTNTDSLYAFRRDCLKIGCFLIRLGEIFVCRDEIYSAELSYNGLDIETLFKNNI